MDETRVRLFVVFLVFVFALAVVRSEGNRKLLGTIFRNRISWISQQEHDQETIEQIWFHCWNKIEHRAEAVQDFNIFLQHDAEKAITDLPPKEKRTLLDCLTRKNLLLDISSNEPPPSTWFRKFFESFLDWSNVPRRYLKSGRHHRRRHRHQHQHHHHHHKAQSLALASVPLEASLAFAPGPSFLKRPRSPSPAPGPALVPIQNSPAPSFLELSTGPSPISQAPTKAPEQSLPPNFDVPPLPIRHPPLQLAPHPSPNNKSDRQKYIVIASVASVVTVLALVALLFFCCLKRNSNKVGPNDGQRDDKPLLNFCLSNIPGSLEKSHAEENSRVKFLKTSSFANNSSICSDDSSPGQAQSPEGNGVPAQTGIAILPVPPGRKAPPSMPPPPPPKPPAPSPPPPPKAVRPPPVPLVKPSPLRPRHRGRSSLGGDDTNGEPDSHKAKLKPFFWDKVLANPDDSMVWHELKAGSFQVNEEMIETLFGYTPAEKSKNEHRKGSSPFDSPPQYIKILDPKKSQNLAILLRALNVTTDEVCDALKEGNELPTELIQTLLKMAPTTEEELKLRLFNDELSQLGPAERFLKALVEIPFAFKRLESLLFISSVQEEVSSIKESFQTLEVACTELKNSRLFLKLLEAVLKTGNRMNDGTFRGDAQAFKLDTLLKLSDVKGTDGKTTLLHFVVQEIIRSEGIRAARTLRESQSMSSMKSEELNNDSTPESAEYYRSLGLQVVSGLSCDLENVRKAAAMDGDSLATLVLKLGVSLGRIKAFFDNEMKSLEEESEFHNTLENFVEHTEDDIKWLVEEEKRIMALVKSTVDYFYRNSGKNEGLRLFVIVRDFLIMLDKACKDVRNSEKMPVSSRPRVTLSPSTSSESCQSVEPDVRQRLFPAIRGLRRDDSSSDDESFSP